jgi:transcriptional regulator with XRE-family HTH domain
MYIMLSSGKEAISMTVGDRIKKRRLELGMSVDDLAKKLGKNRATIYRYESSEIENLPISIIEPLAKILQTSPSYLMGWEEEQQQKKPTTIAAHVPEGVELTEEEQEELNDYIQFLLTKRKK